MTYGVTLDGEYAVVYEKCKHCHLFIHDNPAFEDAEGLARWLHGSRGDEADDAIEAGHDATPSGLIATLGVWQKYGPPAMQVRFVKDDTVVEDDRIGLFLIAARDLHRKLVQRPREQYGDNLDERINRITYEVRYVIQDSVDGAMDVFDALSKISAALWRTSNANVQPFVDQLGAALTKIGVGA